MNKSDELDVYSRALLGFLLVKALLDFFSTSRELNAAVQIGFSGLILLVNGSKWSIRPFVIFSVFYTLAAIGLIIYYPPGLSMGIKYLTFPLFLISIHSISMRIPEKEFIVVLKKFIIIFFVFFLFNWLLSIKQGLYNQRHFFNFEHVNLLGTYVTSISFIVVYLNCKNYKSLLLNLLVPAMALITTSTGAFIASLLCPLSLYFVNKKVAIAKIITSGLSVGLIFYIATLFLSPELHNKVFGFVQFFNDYGGFTKFVDHSLKMQVSLYGVENASSFVWRIFSYSYYIGQFISQDFGNILFGNGFEAYKTFSRFMPHNDFILILIDFGLIPFILFVGYLVKTHQKLLKSGSIMVFPLYILILRLFFENVIYSHYVMTNILVMVSLIGGQVMRNSKNVDIHTRCAQESR